MGETMTFEKLYNHMETYIKCPNERWKLVTRVKRGISDPNSTGSYARDQSYFEGACRILENIDNIDFKLLMSGKICLDELDKLKDVSKLDKIKLPKFFSNMKKYKEKLRHIAIVNGIIDQKPPMPPKIGLSKDIDDLKTNAGCSIPEEDVEVNYHANYREYKRLFEFNQKFLHLDSESIKIYIRKEVIPNTKNNPIFKPFEGEETDSSMCILL